MKFLTRIADGSVKLASALQASLGLSSANQIIATDDAGKLDPSFLPAGVEIQTISAVASEALAAGDFVNVYDDAGTTKVRLADASDVNKIALGFVLEAVAQDGVASVYTKGYNNLVVGAENTKYFLSDSTPGAASTSAPADVAGSFQQVLGFGMGDGILFELDDVIYF
jgi:hypothetical protein